MAITELPLYFYGAPLYEAFADRKREIEMKSSMFLSRSLTMACLVMTVSVTSVCAAADTPCAQIDFKALSSSSFECVTSNGSNVQYDASQENFPYTLTNHEGHVVHVSRILGPIENGTPPRYFSTATQYIPDLHGLRPYVGDDSPALQQCRAIGGELPGEPGVSEIIRNFDYAPPSTHPSGWHVDRLTKTGVLEMLAVMPDLNGKKFWSGSLDRYDPSNAWLFEVTCLGTDIFGGSGCRGGPLSEYTARFNAHPFLCFRH
jgi:hypothetical protein